MFCPSSDVTKKFDFDNLVHSVQHIQKQIIDANKILDDQWENRIAKRQEIKSRSFIFIDPYGHRTSVKFMDHELISTALKKYKKIYIPKYLQKWIKLGRVERDKIKPLTICELTKPVSEYAVGSVLHTYGELIVWIHHNNPTPYDKLVLYVSLMDNMMNIKAKVEEYRTFEHVEFKSVLLENNSNPTDKHWNEGTSLKFEDTILSTELYRDNCIILSNLTKNTVYNNVQVYVNTLTGKVMPFSVRLDMTLGDLKVLIQDRDGIPPDQQRIFTTTLLPENNRSLESYNIKSDSILHLVLNLRGGMYIDISGRNGFDSLPYGLHTPVAKLLDMSRNNILQTNGRTTAELQESILQAQTVLSNFIHELNKVPIPLELPNLANIVSNVTHDYENITDDDDSEDDQ